MTSAKKKLEASKDDFENDVEEIKETVKNEKWNTKRKIKYLIKEESNKLILLGIGIAYVYFSVFGNGLNVEIPEWFYLVGLSMLGTGIVTYPVAQRLARMFIQDNRIPVLELPDEGFEVYKVPRERLDDIEVTEGKPNETQTPRSGKDALELRKFEIVEEKGRQKLIGLGTWEGTFSNTELKRTWENVKAMRDTLVPQARKARQYDLKMPYWIHQMENETINDIVYQFEEGATFSGTDMHKQIKEEMGIDDELPDENEDTESAEMKIERLDEQMGELNEIMKNGDSDD